MRESRSSNVRDLLERVPPASQEAEQGVLGAIMLDNRTFYAARSILDVEDFYRDGHGLIFKAMEELTARNLPIDIITLVDKLGDRLERAGGAAYVSSLPDKVPTATAVESYARTVKEKAILRRTILLSQTIAQEAHEVNGTLAPFIDSVVTRMVNTVSADNPIKTHSSAKEVYLDVAKTLDSQIDGEGVGIKTGIDNLDDLVGGLIPIYYIVAGRPGTGKTTLALNMARRVAQDKHVLIFSAEMSKQQLMHRMIAIETGIDTHKIHYGKLSEKEHRDVYDVGAKFNDMNIHIDDLPEGLYIEKITSQSHYMKRLYDTGLIIVDYIQLITKQPTGSRYNQSREERITDVSRSLKQLAKKLNVPVVALAQFNRPLKGQEKTRMHISDLRESGSLEQDGDQIWLLFQDDDMAAKEQLEITIGKNKFGRCGWCDVTFKKQYQKIF